jgi:hypothetical protein
LLRRNKHLIPLIVLWVIKIVTQIAEYRTKRLL